MDQTVQIVTRKEWMAQGPKPSNKDNQKLLSCPVKNLIIMDTKTQYSNSKYVNSILVKYMECIDVIMHNQNDIRYNFLIGGDGRIYEGCGWDVKGNHTAIWNENAIGIGFIGNFDSNKLNQEQIRNLNALINDGIKTNKIIKDCACKILLNGDINDVDLSYDE